MRMILDGLLLETMEYAEGAEIHLTVYTYDDMLCLGLSERLETEDRVLQLWHGDGRLSVRALEHEVTPPFSRRVGDAVHRHTVRLARVQSAALPTSSAYAPPQRSPWLRANELYRVGGADEARTTPSGPLSFSLHASVKSSLLRFV